MKTKIQGEHLVEVLGVESGGTYLEPSQMMTTYTTREAEARFGEILRKVRMGERVVLVEEGKGVAEIRPVESEASSEVALRELIGEGTIIPAEAPRQKFVPAGRSPGALARFLESRR